MAFDKNAAATFGFATVLVVVVGTPARPAYMGLKPAYVNVRRGRAEHPGCHGRGGGPRRGPARYKALVARSSWMPMEGPVEVVTASRWTC